jgi:ABC-2 type transport system permease protein
MGLSTANTAATVVHLGLLGAEFGALALLVGAVTGRAVVSRAVPAMVAVAAYLINGFGLTVRWLHPVRKLSPFYQYLGHDPIRHGFSLVAIGVTVGCTALLLWLAVVAFGRRDLT